MVVKFVKNVLSGIPSALRGVHKFNVYFEIDDNGILTVSAEHKTSGKTNSITISNVKGMLSSKDEIERMLDEAERFGLEDEEHKKSFNARRLLVNYVYDTRNVVSKVAESTQAKNIEDEIKQAIKWLEEHRVGVSQVFENKTKELKSIWDPILKKI